VEKNCPRIRARYLIQPTTNMKLIFNFKKEKVKTSNMVTIAQKIGLIFVLSPPSFVYLRSL